MLKKIRPISHKSYCSKQRMRPKHEIHTVICLMGPTASGKSALAMQLAQRLNCEIISVDSAMIYRSMDIGSAKPTTKELALIPHHLINIRSPQENYSAANFCHDANNAIKKIIAKNKIPLLVGGTMLYFKALQQGLSAMPSANQKVRAKIIAQAKKIGWQTLHQQLALIDPAAAQRIHPNDAQRIQRALEVYELTGTPISQLQNRNQKQQSIYNFINIAIAPQDRTILHQHITQRFKQMLAQGLIEEVRALYIRKDITQDLPAIKAVGYRQAWDYLAGKLSFTEMQEKAIAATRQLAKRQLTWLRSWPNIHWFDSEDPNLIEAICEIINKT